MVVAHVKAAVLIVEWLPGAAGHAGLQFCINQGSWQGRISIHPIRHSGRQWTSHSFTVQSNWSLHISGTFPKGFFSHSELTVFKPEKERLGNEKEDQATLLNDSKARLQNESKDLFKRCDMITALISTTTCLEQSMKMLLAENKSLFLVYAELLNESNQALQVTPPFRPKE